MTIDFLIVVWGEWHTDALVQYSIPSLLSPGNLPSLRRSFNIAFHIYTTAGDAATIEASPAYQALKRLVFAETVIRPTNTFGEAGQTHVTYWHRGSVLSKKAGNFLCAIPPDMVWGDGTFATVERLLLEGKKAIYAQFLRVSSEGFLREYEGPPVSHRRLMDLAIHHLHPLHRCYLRGTKQVPRHRECALWQIPGGILMRSLATTVLIYHAGEYSLNEHFSLAKPQPDMVFVTDSDQISGVSLSPDHKDSDWYLEGREADFETTGDWWIHFNGETHDDIARQRFWFHATDLDPVAKHIAELRSDAYVTQAMIARDILGVWGVVNDVGCTQAAELLRVAIYHAGLRRFWHWRFPVTVFVPNNAAFRRSPTRRWKQLIGNKTGLVRFLLSHVMTGGIDEGIHLGVTGTQFTIRDDDRWLYVNGLRILHSYQLPRGNIVCVVDGMLDRDSHLQVQDRVQ